MDSKSEQCIAAAFDKVWFIGFIVICFLLFKILRSIWRGLYTCILADLLGATVNWKKLGKWAGKLYRFFF